MTARWLARGTDLARRVATDAQWSGGVCTWRSPDAVALRGDVYEGTAGIAWALAHAAAVAGDGFVWRAAKGAARHALEWATTSPFRPGFYDGTLGALWVIADAGIVLGDDGLVEEAIAGLAANAARATTVSSGFDLVSGTAGSLLALALAVPLHPPLAGEVIELVENLVRRAEPAEIGHCWRAEPVPGAPLPSPLGLAHGASGAALALLAAQRQVGGCMTPVGAVDAFLFERVHFDARACVWRDPASRAPLPMSWCNGSAGMLLARMCALELGAAPAIAAETGAALAAVHTAANAVGREGGAWETANGSLCHGLMATVDLLICANEYFAHPAHRRSAESVADYAIWLATNRGRWPCGTIDTATSYGLMLGLAGISAALLRLHAPQALPSPGLPTRALVTRRR